MNYVIPTRTGRCSATGRPLKAGEPFYSLLRATEVGWERLDFAAEAWQGPVADAVGWWRTEMPADVRPVRQLAATEDLVDCLLAYLERREQDGQETVADDLGKYFALVMLLLQRRALKLLDVDMTAAGNRFRIRVIGQGLTFDIDDPRLPSDALQQAQLDWETWQPETRN